MRVHGGNSHSAKHAHRVPQETHGIVWAYSVELPVLDSERMTIVSLRLEVASAGSVASATKSERESETTTATNKKINI